VGRSGQGHLGSGFSLTTLLFQTGVSWCVQKSGSYSYMGWVTYTHPQKHTHTNIFTLLPFAPRHGSSCRLWIKKCTSVKIQTNMPCLNSALCTTPTKKSLVTNLATQTLDSDKETYLLSSRSRVLLEKLTVSQLVKKFPEFYGTRRFITALTSANHLSLSWVRSIQSIPPHPTY